MWPVLEHGITAIRPFHTTKQDKESMSQHRTWDENRSPQWKYLFQKESANRRKTRKDLDKELHEKLKEEEENYNKTIKFGEDNPRPPKRTGTNKRRKVSKEELKAKQEVTNNEIKRLLKNNNNDSQ